MRPVFRIPKDVLDVHREPWSVFEVFGPRRGLTVSTLVVHVLIVYMLRLA